MRYVALSLGAQGLSYLQPGQWELDISYRYLHSDRLYQGTQEQPQLKDLAIANINSFDVTIDYGLTRRFSLSLTVPFIDARHTSPFDHTDGGNHSMSASGLGDIRLMANAWLLDPATFPSGNIALSVGVKAPTGDYNATDISYTANGPVERPVDFSIQPGDGGWGMVLEMQAYQRIIQNLYLYVTGFYLFNPRNENGVETTGSTPDNVVYNSVPDQYSGRLGLSYVIWPAQGLALSLGGRIDGMPVTDAIGSSDGFRRAGYTISIEPGITWSFGKNVASLFTPVAVVRNEQQTQYSSIGGFADYLIMLSYSRRF